MVSVKKFCALMLSGLALSVQAGIIQGDFTNSLELSKDSYLYDGPKVWSAVSQPVGSGPELVADDNSLRSNPSGWRGGEVDVDLDPNTNILTLTAKDNWNFQLAVFALSNLQFDNGDRITGIQLIENNLVKNPAATDLQMAFSDNSVTIQYATSLFTFNFNDSGVARFQLSVSSDATPAKIAPVPTMGHAAFLMLALMLAWIGSHLHRTRHSNRGI